MAEILIYDYVEEDLWGDIRYGIGQGNLTADKVIALIAAATGDLTVRINSGGGMVFDGFAIYNALKAYDRGKVLVRIEGLAASIASVIAMAGQDIVMCQAAMMMIHKPTTFNGGLMDADALQREAFALNEIEAVLSDIYATRTGLAPAKIQNMIAAETWLAPDTAVALGFANSVERTEMPKPVLPEPVFNHLFQHANPGIKAYVNSAFTIKPNHSMSTVSELLARQEQTNSLLNKVLSAFKRTPKNQVTEAQQPQPEAEDLQARITQLETEREANQDKVAHAETILSQANALYEKVQNQLAGIQSNYVPQAEKKEFKNALSNNEQQGNFIKPHKN